MKLFDLTLQGNEVNIIEQNERLPADYEIKWLTTIISPGWVNKFYPLRNA